MEEDVEYLTIKDLAVELRVKPTTLYAWVAQKKIPFIKLHRLIRFRREDIENWVGSLKHAIGDHRRSMATQKSGESIDVLIARAKRDVYTRHHGETRHLSGSIKKEVRDGAV
jgi:excisionase family DNA binding protein